MTGPLPLSPSRDDRDGSVEIDRPARQPIRVYSEFSVPLVDASLGSESGRSNAIPGRVWLIGRGNVAERAEESGEGDAGSAGRPAGGCRESLFGLRGAGDAVVIVRLSYRLDSE